MSDLTATRDGPTEMPVQFNGNAFEYFGIWITNLLLTIVTLGIYSAWAKVRTQRYFYGNTEIDGHAFEYHANPISILFGRLFIVLAVIFVNVSQYVDPALYYVLAIALLVAMPWLINRSLRFTARMTTYRNVQFDFESGYWRALWACIIAPLIGVITLFLFMPFASRILQKYLADGFSYGGQRFKLTNGSWPYIEAYLVAFTFLLLLSSATAFLYVSGFFGTGLPSQGQSVPAGQAFYLVLVTFAALIAFSTIPTFLRTQLSNILFNSLEFDGKHRFRSEMSPFDMVWIVASNIVIVALTLGLMTPWATIRVISYRLSKTTFLPGDDLGLYQSEATSENAIADEALDALDFPISI